MKTCVASLLRFGKAVELSMLPVCGSPALERAAYHITGQAGLREAFTSDGVTKNPVHFSGNSLNGNHAG